MEITMFDVWLFTRLDIIRELSILLFCVMLIVGGILSGVRFIDEDEMVTKWWNKHKWFIRGYIAIFLIASASMILMPSSKQAAAIYLIPKIVNNEDVQNLPGKLGQIAHGKLDEWIEDLTKDKE